MIQKKYMWGFTLGLLGSGLYISNICAMRGTWQSSQSRNDSIMVGDSNFNNLEIDEQKAHIKSYKNQLTDSNIEKIINKAVQRLAISLKAEQSQQQMTQTPENLYRTYREQYQGQYWSDFYGVYESVLNGMNIRSASDLERAAKKGSEGNQDDQGDQGNEGNQDLGGGAGVKKDDFGSGFGGIGKGKEEEDKSSGVTANRDEIAAALAALLKLSENLTLSQAITNQDQWKAFCNAFAQLVEDGNWKQDQAYTWDGTNLK